jgi:hypothetical protein
MADEKVTNSELVRQRRDMELREFALAEFYPRTHTGAAAHLKRTDDTLAVQRTRSQLHDRPDPAASAAKPWKKP